MGNIDRIDDAWKEISQAASNATFVPVLAFELSCLPQYASMTEQLEQHYPGGSRQLRQLALQHDRIDRACEILKRAAGSSDPEERAIHERAIGYLDDIRPRVSKAVGNPEGALPHEDGADLLCSKPYTILLTNLARLATALTGRWASYLAEEPKPVHFGRQEKAVPTGERCDVAVLYMRQCLNCCAFLYELAKKTGEPNSLKMEWVYVNLLLFASEVFHPGQVWADCDACEENGSCCDIAKETTFKDRHLKFIQSREGTGWRNDFTRSPGGYPIVGVRVSHLRFLQGMLKHLLLAGTRAYRCRSELAFLLVLDDKITQLPVDGVDPFEMGLLLNTLDDRALLSDLLRYCEGATDEINPFYCALARFLRKSRTRALKRAGVVKLHARQQVVVSMALDREMERALAREFDLFRVAIPVQLPVKEIGEDAIREESFGLRTRRAWLVGNCQRENSPLGYRVTSWTSSGGELSHDGPLVLKLFGSPLEDCTSALDVNYGNDSSINLDGKIAHHLVLDENELVSSLLGYLPGHESFCQRLSDSDLFFFGQDALRWSERVPYFLVRSLNSSDGGVRSTSQSVEVAGHQNDKSAVSFGEPGVLGAEALRRLRVRFISGELHPESIIRRFLEEATRHD